jgi:predicted Zn-dependent protease
VARQLQQTGRPDLRSTGICPRMDLKDSPSGRRRYAWLVALPLVWSLVCPGPLPVASQTPPARPRAALRAQAIQAARPLSAAEEYQLGRAVAASILSDHPLYQDHGLTLYVNEVGQVVARKSSRPNPYRGYHFGVLASREPNAFACPGGIILVTLGLLRLCNNEDELAAVLAHEVGHVAHRDGIRSIKKARRSEKVARFRMARAQRRGGPRAELVSQYGDALVEVRKTIVVNGYSRKAEWAADQEALRSLAGAGYNPGALASLLQKIARQEKTGKSWFFRTHPPAKLRLARLEAQGLQTTPAVHGEATRTRRFQNFKKAIPAF